MTVTPSHSAKPSPRVEDDRFVRGLGHFADDLHSDNEAFAAFVRSPHAFARIVSVDAEAALAAPGVTAVITAADLDEAGVGSIAAHPPLPGRNGGKLVVPPRPSLARDRVLHVGEPVAMVVGETRQAALDAVELVQVEYEELAAVVDARDAVKPDAPQLWPEAPGNVAVDWPGPMQDPEANARAVDEIFQTASHVARVDNLVHQRINGTTMEPRAATGRYDPATDGYILYVCTQGAGPVRDQVASAMGIEPGRVRILTEDVGGAFGLKTPNYPEYIPLLIAAKRLGRPVRWVSTRSEAFMSDCHSRDTFSDAELALDEKGRFLALRIRNLTNLGAYVGAVGANLATLNFARCLPAMYDIRHIDVSVACVFSNTVPTAPYRGAGRPEANYVMERLVDEAARVTGIDRIKLRRRNLIKRSAFPYKSPVGVVFDSGDFDGLTDKALALADYESFNERRRQSKKNGKYRGIGVSCFLEHSGGMPTESASLTFPTRDTLVLGLNVQNTGQGHATVFPQLIADRLGIPAERIRHSHGDSAMELKGYASVGSRSAMTAGHAIVRGVETVLRKGKAIAAHVLEAGESDIEYGEGAFRVVGTDRRISLFELAERAGELKARGEIAETLDTKETADTPLTFPNGCHVAEVEIDPQTGEVAVVSYAGVDDAGNVLDHRIVQGQLHGGIAQGLGQVLLESTAYDRENGQLLSASFMDYAMPRAHHMPAIRDDEHPVPATTNPLGVKGVGEAGTTGSLAAIMNAIADAIPNGAGAKLDMPATAEKVWRACQAAAAAAPPTGR